MLWRCRCVLRKRESGAAENTGETMGNSDSADWKLIQVGVVVKDVEKVMADYRYFGMKHLRVPAGQFKGSKQEVTTFTMSSSYFCDETLDSKIVREILTIWNDNFEAIKGGIPAIKNYTPQDMGNMMYPMAHIHPASIETMKALNIPIQ